MQPLATVFAKHIWSGFDGKECELSRSMNGDHYQYASDEKKDEKRDDNLVNRSTTHNIMDDSNKQLKYVKSLSTLSTSSTLSVTSFDQLTQAMRPHFLSLYEKLTAIHLNKADKYRCKYDTTTTPNNNDSNINNCSKLIIVAH